MRPPIASTALLCAALAAPALAAPTASERAEQFLETYNSLYMGLSRVHAEGHWAASTDVNDHNSGYRKGVGMSWAAFTGNAHIIETTLELLEHRAELSPLQVRQLEAIRLYAAENPGNIPDIVDQRVEAEGRAAAALDGYQFCFVPRAADGSCPEPRSANDIDKVLLDSTDLAERERVWLASKDIGRPLKAELADLVRVRNAVAREMGYSSFFHLQVAAYGMTTDEMITLLDGVVASMDPLYRELHTWTGHALAKRYGQPRPAGPLPAHWLPNRWAQSWYGLVPAANLDPYFADWTAERIVKQGEQFYLSMGFEPLPPVVWEKSDLYPVPEGDSRLKNSHASAWDMDLQGDIRSLMSVEPNSQWFFTTHHELGHIYYYVAYDRPGVPPVLRAGANRAFHEAMGELISLASGQIPYLRSQGILPKKAKIDTNEALLVDALERTVVFVPWSAGVMTHFEYELYEKDLPPDQWQARWWQMVEQYQGVLPPGDRLSDPDLCDACSKTHIIDDPAAYYDYAVATVIKHQLHDHICRDIIGTDPHQCDYYGKPEVGEFLRGVMAKGATEDWRTVIQEATGEPLSTKAMVDYYAPLQSWVAKENAKHARKR